MGTTREQETVWSEEAIQEAIGEYARRIGIGDFTPPRAAWFVEDTTKHGKPERVAISQIYAACEYYTSPSYAKLTDGRRISCTYLFQHKPRFVLIRDAYGLCHNWAVVSKNRPI